MDDRKRTLLAVAIALVVVLALLYSFGLNLFSQSPEFNLADPDAVESREPDSTGPGDSGGVTVEVSPNTVQSVVASLSRYASYSRTVSVTYTWEAEQRETVTSQVWEDEGWLRTDTTFSSGLVEHAILGDGVLRLWYSGGNTEHGSRVWQGEAGEASGDLMQRLPTYEDVLALDKADILAAGYVEYGGQPCIYVEAGQHGTGYLSRYWISVTNGLLMAAEREQDGILFYEMSSDEVISPLTASRQIFSLPDGTVLHEVG